MKRLFVWLSTLALLALISATATLQAQAAAVAAKEPGQFSYNPSEEVTLKGTVLRVLTEPSGGMIMGSHILLLTATGAIDASVGRFALKGPTAVSVSTGQQIEVTGVMKVFRNKQVLLARTIKTSSELYTIRTEHGFLVSPQSRERSIRKTAGEGL